MLEKDMRGLMESIVPISRFNKGEAGKIFEEVAKRGQDCEEQQANLRSH